MTTLAYWTHSEHLASNIPIVPCRSRSCKSSSFPGQIAWKAPKQRFHQFSCFLHVLVVFWLFRSLCCGFVSLIAAKVEKALYFIIFFYNLTLTVGCKWWNLYVSPANWTSLMHSCCFKSDAVVTLDIGQYSWLFAAQLIWQTNLYLWLAGLSHILAPSSVSRCMLLARKFRDISPTSWHAKQLAVAVSRCLSAVVRSSILLFYRPPM